MRKFGLMVIVAFSVMAPRVAVAQTTDCAAIATFDAGFSTLKIKFGQHAQMLDEAKDRVAAFPSFEKGTRGEVFVPLRGLVAELAGKHQHVASFKVMLDSYDARLTRLFQVIVDDLKQGLSVGSALENGFTDSDPMTDDVGSWLEAEGPRCKK